MASENKEQLAARLGVLLADLGRDEVAVLVHTAERMVRIGIRDYGTLDVASDRRDSLQETVEEMQDGLVYLATEMERIQQMQARWGVRSLADAASRMREMEAELELLRGMNRGRSCG